MSVNQDRAAMHVLVVDDEVEIASEIVEFLGWDGVPAVAVPSAEVATARLDTSPPGTFTVIVTDVQMSGQDGLSFARDVVARFSEASAVEFIVMSGNSSYSMLGDADRTQVFAFMAKPLQLSALASTILQAHASAILRRRRHRERLEGIFSLRSAAQEMFDRAASIVVKMVRATERGEVTFLDVVTAELGDSLISVLGLDEAGERGGPRALPEQLAHCLGLIRGAGDQLIRLVSFVLIVTEMQRGERLDRPAGISAADVLGTLAASHAAMASTHGQSIHVGPAPGSLVRTDGLCLLSALDQLMANAIRFGNDGQCIHISAAEDGSEIAFQVTDTGPGMDAAQLQNLRQPFLERHMSPLRSCSGLGLGLLLVESAAKAMGGRLDLQSAVGHGTVATIFVPALSPQHGPDAE